MESRVIIILLICLYFTEAKENPHLNIIMQLLKLSRKQIGQFVDGHNSRRLLLVKGKVKGQPPAYDMKPMTWDKELASKAAKWASTHATNHNPDKSVRSGRFTTGENLYWLTSSSMSSRLNVNSVLDAWFKEYKDFRFAPIKNFNGLGPQIGHYTQMAWAKTTHVGCGASEILSNGVKKLMVACNYGPTGNVVGQTPYKVDSSSCGHRRGKCFHRPSRYQRMLEASLHHSYHKRH